MVVDVRVFDHIFRKQVNYVMVKLVVSSWMIYHAHNTVGRYRQHKIEVIVLASQTYLSFIIL